jgi:hypothetical protein
MKNALINIPTVQLPLIIPSPPIVAAPSFFQQNFQQLLLQTSNNNLSGVFEPQPSCRILQGPAQNIPEKKERYTFKIKKSDVQNFLNKK